MYIIKYRYYNELARAKRIPKICLLIFCKKNVGFGVYKSKIGIIMGLLEQKGYPKKRNKEVIIIKNNTFSERLKKSRKDNKLSQEDLAKLVGVSQVVISSYETNDSEPKSCHLSKLAEVLNVSSDYLLGITSEYNQNDSRDIKDNLKTLTSDLKMLYWEFQKILDIKFKEILNEIEKL